MKSLLYSILALWIGFGQSAHSQTNDYRVNTVFDLPYLLESVTGVNQKETLIRTYFNNNKSKMPHQGSPYELTANFIMAQMTYSSLFCEKMIQNDQSKPPEQRWATKSVDYLKAPQQWIGQPLNDLFSDFSVLFWGRPLDPSERQIMLEEWLDFLTEVPATPQSGPVALAGLCSIYLSSPDFLFVR